MRHLDLGTHSSIALFIALFAATAYVPTVSAEEPTSSSSEMKEEMAEMKEEMTETTEKREGMGLNPQFYVEYSLGVSFVRNQNVTGSDPPNADFGGQVEPTEGVSLGGAFGARLYDDFRTEIIFGYQTNEVENQSVRPGITSASGDLSLFTILVNGYYDIPLEDLGLNNLGIPLIPFVGGGVGFGLVRLDAETQGNVFQVDDDDAVFTWNVMAGVTYPFSETTEFSLSYRYLSTVDVRYQGRIADSGTRFVDSEYDSHDLRLGLRFNF